MDRLVDRDLYVLICFPMPGYLQSKKYFNPTVYSCFSLSELAATAIFALASWLVLQSKYKIIHVLDQLAVGDLCVLIYIDPLTYIYSLCRVYIYIYIVPIYVRIKLLGTIRIYWSTYIPIQIQPRVHPPRLGLLSSSSLLSSPSLLSLAPGLHPHLASSKLYYHGMLKNQSHLQYASVWAMTHCYLGRQEIPESHTLCNINCILELLMLQIGFPFMFPWAMHTCCCSRLGHDLLSRFPSWLFLL